MMMISQGEWRKGGKKKWMSGLAREGKVDGVIGVAVGIMERKIGTY